MDSKQFRELVVRPALLVTGLWSKGAEELLMLTWAHESAGGRYLKQVNGPALGPYMIEPDTHKDIWRYINRPDKNVLRLSLPWDDIRSDDSLIWDLAYSTVMCRIRYLPVPAPIPNSQDVDGLASYWKVNYNTGLGKGTVEEAINNYRRYV